MSFPIEQVRADFPLLSRQVNGQPLAYLDSAASAQKPQVVIDRELNFYREGYAAVRRHVRSIPRLHRRSAGLRKARAAPA